MTTTTEQPIRTQLTDAAPCRKQLQVEVPQETVTAEFEEVYRQLKRVAHVPGFRVGNAPRDLLERHHGEKAREEVIRRLVSRSLDEALTSQGPLDLVGRPQVTDVKMEPQRPLTYTAQFDVAPQVPLGPYKGLRLNRPKVEISEENVQKTLLHLQQTHSELKPLLEERASAAGDFLLVDLVQKSPKQPAKKQPEVVIHLDLGKDPEGVVKNLVGMKPGENRASRLKDGTEVSVTLKSIKVKETPALDDAFARSVGTYETLEKLKQAIREDLKRQAEAAQKQGLEEQALQRLTEEWEFDVPQTLVASQARRILKERAVELMNQGVPVEDVQQRAQILTDQAKVDALRQVKIFFLLRRVAAIENLTAAEEEVGRRIATLAQRLGMAEKDLRKDLEEKDLLEEIAWGIIRGKVLDFILKEADVQDSV